MDNYVLRTEHLNKIYKTNYALKDFQIHVPEGSIYALIGKNGAGKTTLTRIITGLSEASSGEIELLHERDKGALQRVRRQIGTLIETPTLYADKSAYANLKINALMKNIPDVSKIQEVLNAVGLEQTGGKKVRDFSLGMRQRVAIAKALLSNPKFLILDEPTNGLDPMGIIEMRNLMLKLHKEYGVTILVSSHILQELSLIATHYGIIHNGSMVSEFTKEEFIESKSKRMLQLKTTNNQRAMELLKEHFRIEVNCIEDGVMIFSKIPENYAEISLWLAKEDIGIIHLNELQQDLEEYYIEQIGELKS